MNNEPEYLKVRRDFKIPSTLVKILNNKLIVKKILITAGIVIVYRLLGFVPLPGIDEYKIRMFFENIAKVQSGTLFGMISMFSTGAMQRLTVLALGIAPYLSSCVIIQLLGLAIPFLKKSYIIGGQEGRKTIVKSTYYLTIALSAVQAFFISLWLENPARFQGLTIVPVPGWGFRIVAVFSIVAGVLLLLWLAKLITNYGLGNGIAIIVLFGILSRLPSAIYQLITMYQQTRITSNHLVLLILATSFSIAVIWMITKSTQKIPIIYKNYKQSKNVITLRFSWVGKAPIGFAQAVVLFPSTIAAFLPSIQGFAAQIVRNVWLYNIVYSISIVFFTYVYLMIVFKPKNVVREMKKYNCQIKDINLGKETEKYLDDKMTKNALVTATFLIAMAVLPGLFGTTTGFPYLIISFIVGLSLIVVVGVLYDLKCQLEAYIAMEEANIKDTWKPTYIAFDEIEAEIKKGFLETRDIPCVVEPLRFTWGLPIKTATDQYRLYVPSKKQKDSLKLLVENN